MEKVVCAKNKGKWGDIPPDSIEMKLKIGKKLKGMSKPGTWEMENLGVDPIPCRRTLSKGGGK